MNLENLTPYQLETLMDVIKDLLGIKLEKTSIGHEIIEIESPVEMCPHCKGIHFIKNGHRLGVQRCLCKDCQSTFGATNDTLLFATKLPYETWIKFIVCELLHMTLLETSLEIGVQKTSCFHMRHCLYSALKELKKN